MEYIDYAEYVKLYSQAIERGLRDEEHMATEPEWDVVSEVTKQQIMVNLKEILG